MPTTRSVISLASLFIAGATASLDPIVIKGSKFFYSSNGTQFYIKGIAYQADATDTTLGYIDPLANETTCKRDIPYMQAAGANLIRTYAIDPTQDHSACMSLLDAAGIYVISDLGEPDLSISRSSPAWNTELYARYTAVVDAMANYTNVIGFFAGNEVTNNASYTGASAFVKAAVRDTKAYITAQGYHSMGVGYAADDDASVRADVADYFNCGDEADIIDFWGYNIYEWCGDSNYETSGYADRTAEFANYSKPVFFAEYGCNTESGGAAGRTFTEVAALYGVNMSGVFSGGIVYEYFEASNDYGLVSVDGTSVSTLADYNAWKTEIASVTVTGVNSASYTPTNTAQQACPTVASTWQVNPSSLPPTPDAELCSCMVASLTCKAKSGLTDTEISTLFSEVCGYNSGKPCTEVSTNTTSGVYGAYSMCNATQQLSYAFNAYYLEEGTSDSCSFGGSAESVSVASTASSCKAALASATASSTSTGSSASKTSKSAADALFVPRAVHIGNSFLGVYLAGSVLIGAAMLML